MKPIRISMGIWGNTNLVDRFNTKGFGEEVPVLDRIRQVGAIDGVDGIELHLPTEINDDNADDIARVLDDHNLRIIQLCGHTWTEKQYKHGALADSDPAVRQAAVDRVKAALDMGARFDVPISVLWPATDGNDFPLQADYLALYERYVESCRRILDHLHANHYATRLCIEPKPFEPRTHIMMGNTAQALCLVNEIDDPNFGINLDVGHAMIAAENVEDQLSLICRYGRLYHTHFNDNDQQCDADLPPGTINFLRLVQILYVLDQVDYDGWFGLDLFPYRDDPRRFIEISRDNLHKAAAVVDLMNDRGAAELRIAGTAGPDMAVLMRDCMGEVLAANVH
ncbi:MAG: sugar phosphate isomerase/epimerase family protein [Planctomycetota bacterium]